MDQPAGFEHLPANSSQNESAHKHWNNSQRSVSGGIIMVLALSHDFILRRNSRIIHNNSLYTQHPFFAATAGSHHLFLVDTALQAHSLFLPQSCSPPAFPGVASNEHFGLLPHDYGISGLLDSLAELKGEDVELLAETNDEVAVEGWQHYLHPVHPPLHHKMVHLGHGNSKQLYSDAFEILDVPLVRLARATLQVAPNLF
ncbi:hypothetical protein BCR35DRAFT_335863 [Leucosporidium creatinivorum]|uniref:Uncharacterized protein n=1 Tax=Leucosporidium creatinivorum TaxID=106004 RepID=A0A1Y2D4L3_9BASI|nr:hypothetical protein BCR35DRAFT_335863 [Leucosporidium creatinivorum]